MVIYRIALEWLKQRTVKPLSVQAYKFEFIDIVSPGWTPSLIDSTHISHENKTNEKRKSSFHFTIKYVEN